MAYSAHTIYVRRLYRQGLRTMFDWSKKHEECRQLQIHLRYKFEANRHVTNQKRLSEILQDTEKQLADLEHPEPYRC